MISRSFLNFPTVISTQQELLNCAKECTRRPLWLSHSHCSNTVTHSHIDSVLLCHMTNNFLDLTVHNGWLCPPWSDGETDSDSIALTHTVHSYSVKAFKQMFQNKRSNKRSLAFEVIRPSTQLFMLQCLFPQIFLQIHFIAFTRLLLHCKRWSTQPPCLQISALISHSQISPSRPAPAVLAEFYPHRAIRLWQIQNAIIHWFLLL